MIHETVDRRCFGAVRFVDASSTQSVGGPLVVGSSVASFARNASGLFVIRAVNDARFSAYDASFAAPPPTAPAVGSVSISARVSDPQGTYLARAFAIALPRDARVADPLPEQSLYTALDVMLYRSPSARLLPGAATVRFSVARASGAPASFALVRVLASDGSPLARGMADARGEGLALVMGIPTTTFSASSGPVLATEISVKIEAIFDPAAADESFVPDPDRLEQNRSSLSVATLDAKLASGRELTISIQVS